MEETYKSMTFQDLKKVARDKSPPIKKYYQMNKSELIKMLCMEELPEDMIIAKMTIPELRQAIVKKEGKTINLWKLSRSELITKLRLCSKKNNQDDNSRQEHNDPEESDPNQVGIQILKNL